MDTEPDNHLANINSFSTEQIEIIKALIHDPAARVAAAEKSFHIFLAVYLNHYLEFPMAQFQHRLIELAEDTTTPFVAVEAFRGSGKSSLITVAYALWSILGYQKKKHIVIISGTMEQAAGHMRNIRLELEENDLLRNDLGPFQEEGIEWRLNSIHLMRHGARIMAASWESLTRGTRRGAHRPDLIIVDDVESPENVRTREGRDKLYRWLTSDIIPMGTPESTKYLLLGTHLHQDSLIERIGRQIQDGKRQGIFRKFPFVDEQGNIAWPSRFTSPDAIQEMKRWVGDDIAWSTEYMLVTPVGERQLVRPEWLRVYRNDQHPGFGGTYDYRGTVISVDPAMSQKENADYSAIVVADIYRTGSDMRIYVTDAINERLTFKQLRDRILALVSRCKNNGGNATVVIEVVQSQIWLAQELSRILSSSTKVEEIHPQGAKEDRLRAAAGFMEANQFWMREPGTEKGMEMLAEELIGFPRESHDDLVDATSQLILFATEDNSHPTFVYPGMGSAAAPQPLPAEVDEYKAKHGQLPAGKEVTPTSLKQFIDLTEEERKKLEHEEDVRLMKESESRRSKGLEGWAS